MFKSRYVSVCALSAIACLAQSNSPGGPVLDLSLEKAIEIATSPLGDATVQMARESEQSSVARYTEARATLLPTLDGSVAEQNQTVNPRALGLRFSSPLFTVPKEVGPFYTFDARARLNQNVLNLSAIRHWQAAHDDVQAARSETESVRERAASTVAKLYTAALRADAQVEVSKAIIVDAEATRDLASHRTSVGEGTELEVARAKLSVARGQQRLLAAETNRTRALLELIKALNLDWDTKLHLTGKFESAHADSSVTESLAIALKSRADFKVQESRAQSAKLNYSAAKFERMPSIIGYADYGVLEGVQTHTIGAALRIPLFDGGRTESDRLQAASLMRQEQIRQKELRSQVELEVRMALAALNSAEQGVHVAEESISLAGEELARARRRYEAGVTNSLEIIDAQTQLEVARDDRVAALFNYANARIDLAQAMGTITKLGS
jgi:outer membrane protein